MRFAPRTFRKRSEWRVANTAFGAVSFLILEAVGATLLAQYGFGNAALAIIATGLIIFLAGLPISVYAARHGLDMGLLTRGAGFGYLGSTITSLVYASVAFIVFALEAAVMAYALELEELQTGSGCAASSKRSGIGSDSTHCRTGTRGMTWSTMCAAVCDTRRAPHEGQKPHRRVRSVAGPPSGVSPWSDRPLQGGEFNGADVGSGSKVIVGAFG